MELEQIGCFSSLPHSSLLWTVFESKALLNLCPLTDSLLCLFWLLSAATFLWEVGASTRLLRQDCRRDLKKKKSFDESRNSASSAVFCQCYSNTPSCSSQLKAADRSPTHPPAGSLRNDKSQVGSASLAVVGPPGTLKTNDNVLGALCRIMKMYPCAPSESQRHQHFKSADPSRRNSPLASPPPHLPPAANGSGGDGEHQSRGARRRRGE